ncbi:MAG: flagellar hook assembly protein FlgD [Rhodobacteraceae bacterium]|jgi:flagellar basal-body rod modification protein FlgD|nr:flagellar hook assembly protein FlgD [Paracoccaceae bacterium]
MDINTANTAAASGAASARPPAAQAKSGLSSDFQTFLKMLTTQIQNQDPLNPKPADEFAVQLATFSSVEQQVLTNELLQGLTGQLGGGISQIAGWVGMEARAQAPVRFDGAPVTILPSPAPGADAAQLVVRNETGREVARVPVAASSDPLVWDGTGSGGQTVLPGVYSFELVSFANGVPTASSTPASYGRVTEARVENGKPVVVLASGATVPASEVSALRQPR